MDVCKYAPATKPEQELVLTKVRSACERLRYLEIAESTCTKDKAQMVQIGLRCRRTTFPQEAVEADFRGVWSEVMAEAGSTICLFVDEEHGFTFRFAVLLDSMRYVTGRVSVDLAERPLTDRSRRKE